MNRYLISGLFLAGTILAILSVPKNGDAGQSTGSLTIVFSGDAVGKIEPCG